MKQVNESRQQNASIRQQPFKTHQSHRLGLDRVSGCVGPVNVKSGLAIAVKVAAFSTILIGQKTVTVLWYWLRGAAIEGQKRIYQESSRDVWLYGKPAQHPATRFIPEMQALNRTVGGSNPRDVCLQTNVVSSCQRSESPHKKSFERSNHDAGMRSCVCNEELSWVSLERQMEIRGENSSNIEYPSLHPIIFFPFAWFTERKFQKRSNVNLK